MELKNYDYLRDSLVKLGFEGVFDKALKSAMQLDRREFDLHAQMSNGERELDFVFKFGQKEEGAFYFLNNVIASCKKENEPVMTHDFFLYRQQGYDLREMVNMLEGRSVQTEFRRDGRNVELWRRIDFTAKDERGNNQVRTTYINNNKFNLAAELNKLPVQGLNAEEKQMVLIALKKGDAVSVVVKKGNDKEKVNLVAMPHLGIIGVLNQQGERISLQNNMLKVVGQEETPALSESTKQMLDATKNGKSQGKEKELEQGAKKKVS